MNNVSVLIISLLSTAKVQRRRQVKTSTNQFIKESQRRGRIFSIAASLLQDDSNRHYPEPIVIYDRHSIGQYAEIPP
jgi:hypothetical protein